MATLKVQQGTTKTWAASGGDETLTLTSLASGSARQGDKTDLGATFAARWGFKLTAPWASSPTSGTLLRIFWSGSEDNTTFAAGASGSDGAFSDTDDLRNALELTPVIADADTTAQVLVGTFYPPARYGSPVIWNDGTGQALGGTAGDFEFVIWPLEDVTS